MPDQFGATPERWRYFSTTLGLTADLLPVVSNPNAEIAEHSTMKGLGKTPSRYNKERKVVGIGDWTEVSASRAEVERWAKEPDYGLCVQTRRLRAIDIDVADEKLVAQIIAALTETIGTEAPVRWRSNSGKKLIPFWMSDELFKHVIPVEGGIVEILGTGQQFIAEGTHPSGSRYEWIDGDIPTLDRNSFAMLLLDLGEFATGPIKIARERKRGENTNLEAADGVSAWLIDNWETFDAGRDGQIFIRCPFEEQHTTEGGDSSTAYFPAGTGGYSEGNFVCLHAHCAGRSQAEFLHATGFTAGAFTDIGGDRNVVADGERQLAAGRGDSDGVGGDSLREGAGERSPERSAMDRGDRAEREVRQELIEAERWPTLTRDSAGKIESTMNNLLLALASPQMIGRHLAYDTFKDELVWAPNHCPRAEAEWRLARDADYALVRQQLELRGFKPMGMEMLRLAILTVSEDHAIDTAQEWLKRLVWDGRPRVAEFAAIGWGWDDTPYARAVGRYTWSALAGRVVQPGIQADMVPVLVGPQGALKTSAVKAMSPSPDFYASLKLDAHDDDTSRLLRGTLVAELEELRGLNSRAVEEIKAWITKTHEKWVPKYREFATTYGRRNLFLATTNEDEIFNDPTGERRWLPGRTKRANPHWIAENRNQLWAEGLSMFLLDGIDWSEAETLARLEHEQFKVADSWTPYVARWLHDEAADVRGAPITWEYLQTHEVLTGALGLAPLAITRGHEMRIGKILRALGMERKKFQPKGASSFNAYVRV